MAVTDFLIGRSGLEDQRDEAIDFAEERYDPAQMSPQVTQARQQATEGIAEGVEGQARQRTVESLFRPSDTSIYGGNQARAIAGQQQRSQQAQQGMAQFESNLTQQDIQSRQQGQQQFAQARTQQNQLSAQRDAAIEEAEMQFESELQKRRQQLGSTIGNLAGTAAGMFLGPAGAAAGGALGGAIFGGGSGAVTGAGAGLTTSFQRQQNQDLMNQLTGEGQDTQPQGQDVSGLVSAGEFGSNLLNQGQGGSAEATPQPQPQRPDVPLQQPIDRMFEENPQVQDSFADTRPIPQDSVDLDNLFGETGRNVNNLFSGIEQNTQSQFEQFRQYERQQALQAAGLTGEDPVGNIPSSFGEAGGRFMEGAQQFGGELDWFRRNVLGFETQQERFNRLTQ